MERRLAQLAIVGERDAGVGQGDTHFRRDQRAQLNFTAFFKPRTSGSQVIAAMARMTHEFRDAFRKSLDDPDQVACAIAAGESESGKPICRTAVMASERVLETSAHQPHQPVLPSDAPGL